MFAANKIANEHPVTIPQIVPRVPGGLDGVGDYALNLAAKLRDGFGCATVFVTPENSSTTCVRDFEVRPLQHLIGTQEFDRIILHYANYGYEKHGVPFRLLSMLRELRRQRGGKLVTIFHELYASGPPWKSAFWLRPFQIYLAKAIARLSDECIVSSQNFLRELRRLLPSAPVHLHPVPSGLGEPDLSREQIADRNSGNWVILGGTVLAEHSLRSFVENIDYVPKPIRPKKLFVLGGEDNPAARSLLAETRIESDYKPRVSASEASEILRKCSFTWFNYFHRPDVETSVALKSSAFGALCAHAVIPVFPHRCTAISIDNDPFPGPFFVEAGLREISNPQDRADVAASIYRWYQRHVSSDHLAGRIAAAMGLSKRDSRS